MSKLGRQPHKTTNRGWGILRHGPRESGVATKQNPNPSIHFRCNCPLRVLCRRACPTGLSLCMALCRGGGNVTVCQLAHVIHSQRAEKKSHRAAWDVPNGLSAPFTKFPFQLFQKPRLKVKSSFTTTHPSLFASFLAFFFLPSYLFPFVTQKKS